MVFVFCSRCGTQNDDNNAFCSNCGSPLTRHQPVDKTEPMAMRPEQQSPSAAYDSLGSSYQTPATVADQVAPRKSKAPLIIAILVIVLLVGGGALAFADPLHVMPWNASRGAATGQAEVKAPEDSGSSSNANSTSGEASSSDSSSQKTDDNVMTEGTANRISPKESIKVSDLKIKEDEVKRYVVTGKVANTSNETYNVTLKFGATRHSSDKYGEETTKKEDLSIHSSVTPYTSAYYDTLTIYDLAPTKDGKELTFTIYPSFSSIEEFLSDPTCEVTEASLPDAHTNWRFDYDKGIDIKSKQVTPDGKAVIDFVNNTNMYLDETEVTFVCYNEQGIPAVANTSGKRPYGAVVKSTNAKTLKPGDKSTFETKIGEGYSKVEILHVTITPDKSKNSFN